MIKLMGYLVLSLAAFVATMLLGAIAVADPDHPLPDAGHGSVVLSFSAG
ncbi:MAG: hypothetical protein AAF713_06295 [Pseudomonadota bacterium]